MHSSHICSTFIIFIFSCYFLERDAWSDNNALKMSRAVIGEMVEAGQKRVEAIKQKIPGNHEDNIALEQLRLWAKQLGIPQEQIDQSSVDRLIQMIKNKTDEQNIEEEKKYIKRISKILGISDEQINNFNTLGLLSEIIIRLDETRKFKQDILNEEELRILNICLDDDKKILDTVKKYHEFLGEIHGHKLIVLPDSPSQQ